MLTTAAARNLALPPFLALLALLSAIPPLAVPAGAAPEAPGPELCVIAPRTETDRGARARATVPVSRPTIFVREALARVRLVRGATVLWQRQAGPEGALQGPIAWPLAPLRPGESLTLQLQPAGGGPAAFAEIRLRAAEGAALRRNDALMAGLGRDPAAWRNAVEQALQRREAALATALLFAFEGPSAPDLDALRLEVFQHSCREEPAPAQATSEQAAAER